MRIYDWYENSERIIQNNAYSSKNQLLKEQIYLVKYLTEQGLTDDEVFDVWMQIPSKYIEAFSNKRELREWFDKHIVTTAHAIKDLKPSNGIAICKSEIDYIDSLDVEVYFKKFLLALLAYSRLGIRKYVKWDRFIRSDLLKMAGLSRVRESTIAQMAQWNRKYLLYDTTPVVFHNKQHIELLNNILLHYDTGNVEAAEYRLPSVEDISILFDKLHERIKICTKCGQGFYVSSKSQTELCPECYKKQRRQNRIEAKRRERARKK